MNEETLPIITFYTRSRCPLCEDAKLMLNLIKDDIPFVLKEYDIDESDELTERFGLMIPVVEINGEIIQYGQIDYFTISKRLHEKS
ncbi:glutaredoxin family protein [Rossellomorea vietnamensis]|uniref:Glutaredoxin family protein n=1 Tax=Rossellomorea vietnamensis TaxID=218284 RepID=A0A5D4NMV6_9BACI|nr:glutaredoxin family protein [Rossellomorea vietnamensis]TYS15260.1 glutaredoxin family protein [Rossellomorea vietnamensis]